MWTVYKYLGLWFTEHVEWNTTDEAIAELLLKQCVHKFLEQGYVEVWELELFQSCLIAVYSQ